MMIRMGDLVAWADIIGIIAGILVMSSSIPQIIKSYKSKKMTDVSIYLMSLIASGLFLWIIYGLIRSDPIIIGTNAAGLGLNITLLIMKIKYEKMQSSTCESVTVQNYWTINNIYYFYWTTIELSQMPANRIVFHLCKSLPQMNTQPRYLNAKNLDLFRLYGIVEVAFQTISSY